MSKHFVNHSALQMLLSVIILLREPLNEAPELTGILEHCSPTEAKNYS